MSEDIIVIGRIKRDGGSDSAAYATLSYTGPVNADFGDRLQGGWEDTSEYASAAVRVHVSDPANLAAATIAADNVARGLAELESKFDHLDPNTTINWDGQTMTAGKALDIINNTTWIVSDQSNYNNGGVGSADYVNHTDTLNYRAFDGVIGPGEQGDYAHPNYQHDEGLIGILAHEVAHLSDAGQDWFSRSYSDYRQEHGDYVGFENSDYYRNNEEFASDFAVAAGQAFGVDIANAGLPYYNGSGATDPDQTLINHSLF